MTIAQKERRVYTLDLEDIEAKDRDLAEDGCERVDTVPDETGLAVSATYERSPHSSDCSLVPHQRDTWKAMARGLMDVLMEPRKGLAGPRAAEFTEKSADWMYAIRVEVG